MAKKCPETDMSVSEIKPNIVDGEPLCSADCPRVFSFKNRFCCSHAYSPFRQIVEGQLCVPGMRQQRDEWKKALRSLTPGGSEYTDPKACVEFVRTAMHTQLEVIKSIKRERRESGRENES